ncbi:serine protease 27-like [Gopherus evgoodei]|uniref:serine protease 27-like n=1 Tax=Gopherus evgoodei TaxID=1825980 RepID=UPI0011CF212D|nr:serine protease 27-like [Gopherus evgoodei]
MGCLCSPVALALLAITLLQGPQGTWNQQLFPPICLSCEPRGAPAVQSLPEPGLVSCAPDPHPPRLQQGDPCSRHRPSAVPVRYTDEILPVCLPGPSYSFPDNHMCWVTGWGRIDSEVSLPPPKPLQEVQVQLIDTAACNTLYNINPAPNIGRDSIKPDMICAGYAEGQRDSCQVS